MYDLSGSRSGSNELAMHCKYYHVYTVEYTPIVYMTWDVNIGWGRYTDKDHHIIDSQAALKLAFVWA